MLNALKHLSVTVYSIAISPPKNVLFFFSFIFHAVACSLSLFYIFFHFVFSLSFSEDANVSVFFFRVWLLPFFFFLTDMQEHHFVFFWLILVYLSCNLLTIIFSQFGIFFQCRASLNLGFFYFGLILCGSSYAVNFFLRFILLFTCSS